MYLSATKWRKDENGVRKWDDVRVPPLGACHLEYDSVQMTKLKIKTPKT